ncbi:hypothetical protein V6Z11_D10G172100 [Gossypium hirsutum]
MGSFIGWVVAYYFNFLCEWSSTGTFFIFSAFCCANFILLAIMVPRLKDEHWRKYKHQVSGSPFNPQPWRNRSTFLFFCLLSVLFLCVETALIFLFILY